MVIEEGLYHFTFHVLISKNTHIQLRVDGKVVCERKSPQSGYTPASCSTIQQLRSGQAVDVYLVSGVTYPSDKKENFFHGVLLK